MDLINQKLLKIKETLIDNERYEEAIDNLKKLNNKYPTNAEIFHLLGMAYRKVEEYGLAVECFAKAKKINPKINGLDLELYFSAGLLIKNEGLEKLSQFDIDENTLYGIRASYYYKLELYEQAITELKKLIEVNPTHWPAYTKIAENYLKTGDLEKALNFYDKALSTNSIEFVGIIEILFEKSRLYIKCNNFKDASITLQRLLEITIEDIEKYIDSLDFLHVHDEYNELIEICEQQIKRSFKDIHAILSKGIIFLLKREFFEAKDNFFSAISLSPKSPIPHFCFGVTLYLLEEPEKAIKSILSACELDFTNNYYKSFYKQLKKEIDF